jgi:hypothetical protein
LPTARLQVSIIRQPFPILDARPNMVSINLSLRANDQLMYQLCYLECHSWFRKSESSLPKLLKPPSIGNVSFSLANGNLRLETARSDLVAAREDRRSYKNISIYMTELPPTPTLWVPRNSPLSAYQKGEGSSPPLPQTSERPDSFGSTHHARADQGG